MLDVLRTNAQNIVSISAGILCGISYSVTEPVFRVPVDKLMYNECAQTFSTNFRTHNAEMCSDS
jgi:hypothetical protein